MMLQRKITRLAAPLLAAAMLGSCAFGGENDALRFADPTLEDALRSAVGKSEGALTAADLAGITELDLHGLGIADISPLAYLDSLKTVILYDNPISNYSHIKHVFAAIVDADSLGSLTNAAAHSVFIRPTDADEVPFSKAVHDAAHVFTEDEEKKISAYFGDIRKLCGVDISVLTVPSVEGYDSLDGLARDYFDISATYRGKCNGRVGIVMTEDEGCVLLDSAASAIFDGVTLAAPISFDGFLSFTSAVESALNGYLEASRSNVRLLAVSDPTVESALRSAAQKPYGALTAADLTDSDRLELPSLGITDISFIKHLPHLKYVDLSGNEIGDFSPLQALVSPEYIDLSDTKITDLTPLAELPSSAELRLEGITPDSWKPIEHIENVIGRPEISYTDGGYPITPDGNYHSAIPSLAKTDEPRCEILNDSADFFNFIEEQLIKGYINGYLPDLGFDIAVVTVRTTEGYGYSDGYLTGDFNRDYGYYNGMTPTDDHAVLSYVTSTGDWVLTVSGRAADVLFSSGLLSDTADFRSDGNLVRGHGYESLLELMYGLMDSV